MNEYDTISEPLRNLIDDYLSGLLDEAGTAELDRSLREDPAGLRYFARYARMHTDLHLELRSHQLSSRVLEQIEMQSAAGGLSTSKFAAPKHGRTNRSWQPAMLATAAGLLLALTATGWWVTARIGSPESAGDGAIAWLVNAQNCAWASGIEPAGTMRAGSVLEIERGLAEVRFQCGARVVLEGPCRLELLTGKSARVLQGKLTARVPAPVTGFEILSPQGKVIDLGTEFGVAVSDKGDTAVYVFEGKVEAYAAESDARGAVSLTQNQSARIAEGRVTVQPAAADADQFVRAIVPPPVIVPRTFRLDFDRAGQGGIRDANGLATGLPVRLPGTGADLPANDPNLVLNLEKKQLQLTTTNTDLNTQYRLHRGEYLGVRLSDLGFTGKEDFAATVTIPNIPALKEVGQFGLYAGAWSDRNIRGGLLSSPREPGQYTQFLVNNNDGKDANFGRVGLLSPGSSLRLILRRSEGKYALALEDLTTGSTSTLTIPHPEFLDGEKDLYVGLFGANTQSEVRKTLVVKEFGVTVMTTAPAAGPAKE